MRTPTGPTDDPPGRVGLVAFGMICMRVGYNPREILNNEKISKDITQQRATSTGTCTFTSQYSSSRYQYIYLVHNTPEYMRTGITIAFYAHWLLVVCRLSTSVRYFSLVIYHDTSTAAVQQHLVQWHDEWRGCAFSKPLLPCTRE